MIRVGDDTQILKAGENAGESARQQPLTLQINQPGKVTFTIGCTQAPPPRNKR